MFKKFFIVTALTTALLSCSNQDTKRDVKLEKIKKDPAALTTIQWLDTMFDLGTINSGDIKELKYKFKNTGSKPLFLGDVSVGCGCTVPSFSKNEVKPGEEGFVTASFNSKRQCGELKKYIIVPSNASNDSLRYLYFTVNVINCEGNDKVVPKAATPDDPTEIKGESSTNKKTNLTIDTKN